MRDYLRKPVFLAVLMSCATAPAASFAGTIVINSRDANALLKYLDDNGAEENLLVSWSELRLTSKVKSYLVSTYGPAGKDFPFMIDRASQTVRILVDRALGKYETIALSSL
jgi:hypothetical protein